MAQSMPSRLRPVRALVPEGSSNFHPLIERGKTALCGICPAPRRIEGARSRVALRAVRVSLVLALCSTPRRGARIFPGVAASE